MKRTICGLCAKTVPTLTMGRHMVDNHPIVSFYRDSSHNLKCGECDEYTGVFNKLIEHYKSKHWHIPISPARSALLLPAPTIDQIMQKEIDKRLQETVKPLVSRIANVEKMLGAIKQILS